MPDKDLTNLKIGVLGGGQLGRMLALDWARLGVHPYFLDKQTDYPAGLVSSRMTVGDFTNAEDVYAFGADKDIITIEIENVSTEGLKRLQAEGKKVYPQPDIIALIQDKGLQKEFYVNHQFPTARYQLAANQTEAKLIIATGNFQYPVVQKMRKGGYDGKGVQVIKNADELDNLWDDPSVIEHGVAIDKELAVVVGRSAKGETTSYDPVEMVFNQVGNVLDYQQVPARINENQERIVRAMAISLANELEIVGLLAVEFFLDQEGNILINEMAPRTHNSGHHSLDACRCSQFEQQLRAITGMPLGDTSLTSPCFMLNLLGEPNSTGQATYSGSDGALGLPEVKLHIYGKEVSKPLRKMGHINILSEDISLVHQVKQQLKVYGSE